MKLRNIKKEDGAPDWEKQMIISYGFENNTVEQYDFGEDVPVGIYEGFSIKVD